MNSDVERSAIKVAPSTAGLTERSAEASGQERPGSPARKARFRPARFLFPGFPAEREAEFKEHYNRTSAPVAWLAALLAECLYLPFYFWDRLVGDQRASWILMVRVAVCAWILGVLLVNRTSFARHLQVLMGSIIVIGGGGVVAIAFILGFWGRLDGICGVMLVLMFNFGFLRLLFVPSVLCGLVVCVAYNVANVIAGSVGQSFLAAGVGDSLLIVNDFFLVSALVSGASVTYLLERLFRSQFLGERELAAEREALAQKHQADGRYLDWLSQLAAFLRHEVRQPVAQITSSMELISLAQGQDDRVRPYVANASLAVQQVYNLIERASLATDAEAFVRQGTPLLIDLGRLLADLVQNYQQSYSGVRIGFMNAAVAEVRADPALVKEAVGNLLANAISYARDDSAIRVGLELDGRSATVMVCNEGPLLEGDMEAMFKPFGSTRAGPFSEHQGLGLYLVRLIAERHGGTAALANVADGSGVRASITLPLANYGSSTQR